MKTRPALVPLFCFLLAAAPALAAGKHGSESNASFDAKRIIDKNVDARGGLKAWHAVQTMRMTGKIDAGTLRTKPPVPLYAMTKTKYRVSKSAPETKVIQLPFVMDLKRPNKMRFEMEFRGDTAVQAYDGTSGWKLRPFIGRNEVEPYTQEEIKQAAQQQQLDGFLIDYAAKGSKVEADGMDKVNGHEAYKLKLTLKDGQVRHVWVDAKTFLDVKIDGTRRMDGKPRQVATYMSDYRTVKGVKVPFAMETSVEGVKGSERIAIKQVEVNPKLADAQFTKPDLK
jgi:outer membrane lipoprotein-sorting protein